jgi:preprotein translocase subunit SecA
MFDVQLMGGIVLHEGDIAEMKTGEGKTFVASLALYLNGLAGRGAPRHRQRLPRPARRRVEPARLRVARDDVAYIETMMPFPSGKAAYAADVTYGTNSEFGFDYLRDNMAVNLEGLVQRGHPYAIVDEVDSILIDEARTPLIISGEPETAAQIYNDFARIVRQLVPFRASPGDPKGAAEAAGADYEFDEKHETVGVTPQGVEKVERALRIDNLYSPENTQLVNHLYQALKAESLYHLDIKYVIQDGEVKIVDEFTGRIMEGAAGARAPPGGRGEGGREDPGGAPDARHDHAPELLPPLREARRHDRHREDGGEGVRRDLQPRRRRDPHQRAGRPRRRERPRLQDEGGKFAAVVRDIEERTRKGQPVLVGTIAVETSEYLSQLLTRKGIKHNVLNAKEHAREAEIIKDAGQRGAVTIATNMAGRGVDIKLGDGVRDVGGLYVLGTERHEARRIDNQLRGRSGRQGDDGETRFYLSGEDDLVRLFAGDRIKGIMERFKIPEDQPMEAKILSRQIEGAQKKVEEQNFVMRKNVLKYDDVLNRHRWGIYEQRRQVLEGRTSPSRSRAGSTRSSRTRSTSSPRRSTPRTGTSRRSRRRWHSCTRPRSRPPSCVRTSARSPGRGSSRSSRPTPATSTRRRRRSSAPS